MSGIFIILLLGAVTGLALWQFFKNGTGPVLFVKEVRSFFLSPVAWVVLTLVMLLNGFSFTAALEDLRSGDRAVTLAVYTFNSVQFWLAYFFIFPVITMRLFAEEQKLGTIETLLTAPVSTLQVLLAKYLAALTFYTVLWLPSALHFLAFRIAAGEGGGAIGSLTGSYTIIFLLGVFNVAIGCLASSLTKNQLVAAMACFTFCLLHFLIGLLVEGAEIAEQYRSFTGYVSTIGHVRTFVDGLIDTRQFVYYISFAILLLTCTYHVLEFRKWKV